MFANWMDSFINGPWTAPADYRERMGSREAWEAFRNYPAPEGYYFLGYFQEYRSKRSFRSGWNCQCGR